MSGIWTVTNIGSGAIHTYTAPEEGWLVTSHVIELPSQLFVVDAQYTIPAAKEVAKYCTTLAKPLTRLLVTHYHPDHLLGAAAFDAPLFTLESVGTKIAQVGDRVAREEHAILGDAIPDTCRKSDQTIREGSEIVDGVQIEFYRLRTAETEDALSIGFPQSGTIIVQDLVYNRAHPFLGERRFERWRSMLREYRAKGFDKILPGHGLPGGKEVYDAMITYLEFAEEALKGSPKSADFRSKLIERFPDYGARTVLNHQLRFLFPNDKGDHHA